MDKSESNNRENLSPATDALLEELRRTSLHYRNTRRLQNTAVFLQLFSVALVRILQAWLGRDTPIASVLSVIRDVIGITFGITVLVIWFNEWERRARTRQLIQKLRADVRAVGPLALMLQHHLSRAVKSDAVKALKALLPGLQASDARYITSEQMDALVSLLNSASAVLADKELARQVINAMEQVGDKRALEPMERLAGLWQDPQTQRAAQECLPFLRARIEEQKLAETLLRPSSAENVKPETLLRPAAADIVSEGQAQLLRPVE
jgi:hypothetical protein